MTDKSNSRADHDAAGKRSLGPSQKGLPTRISTDDIAARRWNVLAGDLPFPVAVLKQSALARNSRWMRDFIAATGISLAPHGKTTMAPKLFHQQIADGCWGITVATAQQAAVAAKYGIKRILIANQLVGRANIAVILDLLRQYPELELYCYVDSPAGVAQLSTAIAGTGLSLNLLLEVGFHGGRTGCRDRAAVQETLDAVAAADRGLRLGGVAGYEGLIKAADTATSEKAVLSFLDLLIEAFDLCHRRDAFKPTADGSSEIVVSAGGSSYFDLVARRLTPLREQGDVRIVIRSGCYLTHDHGIYAEEFPDLQRRIGSELAARLGRMEPALYLWAMVQSQPEPGLALLTLGKRDAGHDAGLPMPVMRRPASGGTSLPLDAAWRIDRMNDQHGYLIFPPEAPVAVGDLICLGISHPCTTFDKWRNLFVVDDDWTVTDSIPTYF
ncbi:MAG TPA: amino acid deaminase [Dongiaceae bacterium]|nr:amino acid deaminase [Dongiaceae bacterium]